MPIAEISLDELLNDWERVLERIQLGERLQIVADDRTIAEIALPERPQRWTTREHFLKNFVQADPGLRDDLDRMYESFRA